MKPAPASGQARAISIVTGCKGSAVERARRPKRRSVTAVRWPLSPEPSVTHVFFRSLSFTGLGCAQPPAPRPGVLASTFIAWKWIAPIH